MIVLISKRPKTRICKQWCSKWSIIFFQQQQKRRKNSGNLHFASEVAKKSGNNQEDEGENIKYCPKDDDLIDFQKLKVKETQDDDSDDDDLYN